MDYGQLRYGIVMHPSRQLNRELTIRLIQRYGEHRLLWDNKHPHHLVSKMRKESWTKIANEYKWPISVLKKKMASLLGSHRRELHREKKSRIRAAATGNPRYVYSSKWFGYTHFDFMRKNRNKLVKTHHPESIDDSQLSSQTANEDTDASSTELQQSHTTDELEQVMILSPRQPSRNKRRRSSELSGEESEYEEEDNSLTQSLSFLRNASNVANDPYTSFGNYIVSELRKYDPRTLACVKHAIHNVIFEADLGNIQLNTSDHLAHPSQSSSSFVTGTLTKFSPAASDDVLSS